MTISLNPFKTVAPMPTVIAVSSHLTTFSSSTVPSSPQSAYVTLPASHTDKDLEKECKKIPDSFSIIHFCRKQFP